MFLVEFEGTELKAFYTSLLENNDSFPADINDECFTTEFGEVDRLAVIAKLNNQTAYYVFTKLNIFTEGRELYN